MQIDPQAATLNKAIETNNSAVFSLLSTKGKAIFFPQEGIISQSAEAKNTKLNASIGTAVEDDGSPMRLSAIAGNIKLDPAKVFPYASSYGLQKLREVWLEHIKQKNPSLQVQATLPVVTAALTHGLYTAAYLLVDPGDNIIVPDKYWENYDLIFEHGFGGKLQTYNTFTNGAFDIASFRAALEAPGDKKIVLFNFPNNPAGYTVTDQEAQQIIEDLKKSAANGKKIAVLCDDAYFGLVYESGVYRESLFAQLANAHKNILAVKIDGATKEDYAWGLRVGFLTFGYPGLEEKAAKAWEAKTGGTVRETISSASNLSQSLLLEALQNPGYDKEKQAKFLILQERFLASKEALQNNDYSEFFSALPFNSGYFLCLELKPGLDADKVRRVLIDKYDTGTIAISPSLLRVAYSGIAKKDIAQLFENIYRACKETRNGR